MNIARQRGSRFTLSCGVVWFALWLMACGGGEPTDGSSEPEAVGAAQQSVSLPSTLPAAPEGATCVLIQRGNAGAVQDTDIGPGNGANWAAGAYPFTWTGNEHWSAFQFDLGSIPPGSQVLLAAFTTYVSWNATSATVRAHRITAPWSEGSATWASFGGNGSWDPAVLGAFDPIGVGHKTLDVTSLVQAWQAGGVPNHGLLLEEDASALHNYFASEASSATNRPSLYVCYAIGDVGPCSGAADSSPCEDGNECTSGEACQNGQCVGGVPKTCEPLDACHESGICDPATGACPTLTKADGALCDDGNPCTQTDTCQAGSCLGDDPLLCPPPDPCHESGACDQVSGQCHYPVIQGCEIPPDPSSVAPPLDSTASETLFSAVQFLFEGADPIQKGVVPGSLNAATIGVVRGRALDRDGAPLAGVEVAILGAPEMGHSHSRLDGMFDIAVSGGRSLTVTYTRQGYLPVQRTLQVHSQEYAWAPEVVMTPLDTAVTEVDLVAPGMKIARGNPVSDADGARRATLLFPAGLTATMQLPNGSVQPLDELHIRATEYTVGPNGPKAMPGTLPPTSGYTYAVELSADEAIASGATTVTFSQPVPFYVENFVGFPVGRVVPTGYYDAQKAAWIPSANGRVVKILSVAAGMASLDVQGTGTPSSSADLAALGITDDERAALATLYPAGSTFWRVPIPHLTPWDHNWPYGPPLGARPAQTEAADSSGPENEPSCEVGSVIRCETQTLGESVPIVGAPFALSYSSSRARGFTAWRKLAIPLSTGTLPPQLKRIEVRILVAGQNHSSVFSPQTNLTQAFTWDGQDAYGRTPNGAQPYRVSIGYVYPVVYQDPATFAQSFANLGNSTVVSASRPDQEITLWRDQHGYLGTWGAPASRFDAWRISSHHALDVNQKVLYLGSGDIRRLENLDQYTVEVFAGTGQPGSQYGPPDGDGGNAVDAKLYQPIGIAADPAGNVFFSASDRIRKVSPNGILTTIAGIDQPVGPLGDNGPALAAKLFLPMALKVDSVGNLLFADSSNHRIRKIAPDGIITTLAGGGFPDWTDDGAPAIGGMLRYPGAVALCPDGALYMSANGNSPFSAYAVQNGVMRRVGLDGRFATVTSGPNGSNFWMAGAVQPALQAPVNSVRGLFCSGNGEVYFADNFNVGKLSPDGRIRNVAGHPSAALLGDGGAATAAMIRPKDVLQDRAGNLIVVDFESAGRVRLIDSTGRIRTIAGTSQSSPPCTAVPNGAPATSVPLRSAFQAALLPSGDILVTNPNCHQILRLRRSTTAATAGQPIGADGTWRIPSRDGGEIYVFDQAGRHLSTRSTLTGAETQVFGYDPAGRLTSITDGSGNTTVLQRDGDGAPTAIIAPEGQVTTLTVDGAGNVVDVTGPGGENTAFTYDAGGLLTSMTDPNGHVKTFTYDADGRLQKDQDAEGGYKTFDRVVQGGKVTVKMKTALSAQKEFAIDRLATGVVTRSRLGKDALSTTKQMTPDGQIVLTRPDGSVTTTTRRPDPRFGMNVPLSGSSTETMPSGLTRTLEHTRSVTLTSPNDLLALATQTDVRKVNGASWTSTFSKASLELTTTSPAGRSMTATIDSLGRPTSIVVPGVLPVTFTYDAKGRLTSTVQGSRARSRTYAASGFLASEADPLQQIVSYQRDASGRTLDLFHADGATTGFSYDSNGNLLSLVPPGRPPHFMAYDSVNQEVSYQPPAEGLPHPQTETAHDLDRALTQVIRPDGTTLTYARDGAGRLVSLSTGADHKLYSYSPSTGRLTSVTTASGQALTFVHDGHLLKSETWQGPVNGTVSRTYDNGFRVSSTSVNGSGAVSLGYDADGLLTSAGALAIARDPQNGRIVGTAIGNVQDSYTYSPFGEVLGYTAHVGGSILLAIQYVRDDLGRIVAETETVQGVVEQRGFTYDAAGRLVGASVDGVTTSYAYDANGNRLDRVTPAGSEVSTYDDQDRVVTHGGATCAHNANGERIARVDADGTTTYSHDAWGRLVGVTSPDGTAIQYLLDGLGRRVGRKVDGVLAEQYLYEDPLRISAVLDGGGALVARFVYANRPNVPEYMVKAGAVYRLLTDHLGSVRLVVDVATGAVAQEMAFDEFGRTLLDTHPGFQPFGFAGGLFDAQSSVVSFGARDYDAMTGRWLQREPLRFGAGDTNLYVYARNDPVNAIDPNGLTTIGVGVGGSLTPAPGVTVGVNGQLVADDKGNLGFAFTACAGAVTEAFGGSLGLMGSFSGNAESIFGLEGRSTERGVSTALGGGARSDSTNGVITYSGSWGLDAGLSPADFYSQACQTVVLPIFEWDRFVQQFNFDLGLCPGPF